MILKELTITGFKSFANKTTFKFDNPKSNNLTAIVGPNGSGKSNISDAILWVLGEQKLKELRAKQSADVIFAGTKKNPPKSKAKVTLHFDNSQGKLVPEYSQLEISRQIDRSGNSDYYLNNRKIKRQDLQLLLAAAQIGQNSYAVIGQGQATQLLTSTEAERRLFFDDATGVKEYQLKKHQANLKLKSSLAKIKETELLISNQKPHLDNLTKQVKQKTKKAQLMDRLSSAQVQYYGQQLQELNQTIKTKKEEFRTINQQEQASQQKNQQLRAKLDRLSQQFSPKNKTDLAQKLATKHQQQQVLNQEIFKLNQLLKAPPQADLVWSQKKLAQLQTKQQQTETELKLLGADHSQTLTKTQQETDRQLKELSQQLTKEEANLTVLQQKQAPNQPQLLTKLNQQYQRLFQDFKDNYQQLLTSNQTTRSQILKNQQTQLTDLNKLVQQLAPNPVADKKKQQQAITLNKIKELTQQFKKLEQLSQKNLRQQQSQQQINLKRDWLTKTNQELTTEIQQLKLKITKITPKQTPQTKEKKELATKQSASSNLQKEIKSLTLELQKQQVNHQKWQKELNQGQQEQRQEQNQLNHLQSLAAVIKVELTKAEEKKDRLTKEITTETKAEQQTEIYKFKPQPSAKKINYQELVQLKTQIGTIGEIDELIVQEQAELAQKHQFMQQQSDDLKQASQELTKVIQKLDLKINRQFKAGIDQINSYFGRYFKQLFQGGQAKLESSWSKNEEGEKIDGLKISSQPAGKKVKYAQLLSGGERSMVAIALIAAIIASNPAPFVVLDEVDAALDESNSNLFANILQELAKKTQIIMITHNRATMSKANTLYGITMQNSISRLLSLELSDR